MYGETRLCFLSFKSIYGDMRFGILSPHNHLMSRDSVSFLLYQCMETLDSASSPYNRWVSRDSGSLFSYQCIGTWDSILSPHNRWASRRVGQPFFSKERNILAFFCVLYERMLRSLSSFTFFIKECRVLCFLLRSL